MGQKFKNAWREMYNFKCLYQKKRKVSNLILSFHIKKQTNITGNPNHAEGKK